MTDEPILLPAPAPPLPLPRMHEADLSPRYRERQRPPLCDPSCPPGCTNCDSYSPRDGSGMWHIRRDVPLALIGTIVVVILAIGGWVWWFSGQASAMADTQHRVTMLETKRDDADKLANDITGRLARIEGKIEIMLTRVGK